jgi:LmbE family N-acetylglucosaminyl deacetylase
MNVVVVAAHPDDEVLGAGATLARHVRAGDDVHAVVLADGAMSRYEAHMVGELQSGGVAAARHIGFSSVRFESFPDQRLDQVAIVDLTQHVENVLADLQPDVVYTHFRGDVNADHKLVAQAVWTACRPYRMPNLRLIAAFETPSSTEWCCPVDGVAFRPTLFVDVTETIECKLSAMACYESELREYPHPRSLQALRERASYWGSTVGCMAAEPFLVLRDIR